MDAIKFLLNEHNKVRKTFTEISDESHHFTTKKKMFDELCDDLIRHETMEHQVWYPHFKHHEKIDDTVKHLLTEEKHAEMAIKAFEKVKTEAEWEERFKKFKSDVEHHASEEEQKLFPKVEKILSEEQLEQIGKEMAVFKKDYEQ